ncbi:MAG: DNA polymerase III subunit alpha, partial [Gemmatimonadota bacterium]|nr:DNA polymerase III subunit alpha [Gemmatimonadota bacterium]MDQ8149707.1 DNA polymerase III subunit alpha [Gemmatimonadota bacterium]MDQ8177185.1 DNA polymerase III subunit alpha [Gemmatimonadota bacterium]
MSFVHLHCHSEYSLLDGANRIDDLIARAKEFEQPALAITDHGNLHAAWAFQEQARKAGVKPIIGMEAYVAPGDRRVKTRAQAGEKNYFHLVLLARDLAGYRNLVKLSSLAYTEGFYGKPRVDRELLAAHHEGLIVSSACMAGEVAQHLLEDRYDEARATAAWYAELFQGRYYLEVQAHEAGEQRRLNDLVFRLGKDLGLPVVATNDAHFLKAEDHDAHDVLLCIGLKKDRLDADRLRYDRGLYFKSAPEMAAVFPDRPDVLENTCAIADAVDVQFEKKYFVPAFPLPKGVKSENDLLVKLATAGAKTRYGTPLPAEVKERLDYELGVITKTGYAGYFLITADFIQAARDRGIPVGPGRGSAAGSLVAYATGITNVCPLKFDLLFERFLNPERVSMPDIDVDFCEERRGEVIEYVREKYGRESVGQIITFGTLKSRACIKDVGRVLGFTPAETDAIAKLVPNQPNFSLTVAEAIEKVPEVRKLYEQDERHAQLFDFAIALEGLSRHAGVHAAGIVIAPGPLDDYVPVCTAESKGSGGGGDERVVVTQYDMVALEKAGMLKMDFLGLTTLTILTDALRAIHDRRGVTIDLDALPLDDEATYRMLRAGRTAGVFQFESPLATDMVRAMRADRFDDLVASNALMRPGPLDAGMHKVYQRRKKGEEPVSYQLPELEEILAPTYGVITYQEQVMRIAQRLAGISLAEADVLRKAVGKKDAELIRQELGKFSTKAVANGFPPKVIEDIASQIETFGRYGFNKSHSVAYSILSYHTAYLKAHYAPEFMAAVLSACIGDTDAVVKYIAEARDLGLEILPPDVNESGWKFTVIGDQRIRFGLGAIRNVGHSAVESILAARAERPFTSLYDLCERIDLRTCNKRVLEALIHAGALDGLGGHRAQFVAALDGAIQAASLAQAEIATGQGSLFGDLLGGGEAETTAAPLQPTLPNVAPFSESERLTQEKAILGFYISGHPLEPFRAECELLATHTVSQLGTWTPDAIALAGVVTAIKRQVSKKSGNEFARLTVEDFSGAAELLVFPEAWAAIGDRIQADIPVLLKGGYSRRDQDADNPTFIVESVTRLAELRATGQFAVRLELDAETGVPTGVMQDVRAIAEAHPGSAPLELRWKGRDGVPARMRSSLRLSAAGPALSELRALLGDDRVKLV